MKQISHIPWKVPPLNEWTIVGMNHYRDGKTYSSNGVHLYVAMTKGDLCIRAEGADDERVWNDLAVKSILTAFPKRFILNFDPAKSEDADIKVIFSDHRGGLVWCALRHARLTDQFFNQKIAAMLTALRDLPPDSSRWFRHDYRDIAKHLPRSIFGNSENLDYWAASSNGW